MKLFWLITLLSFGAHAQIIKTVIAPGQDTPGNQAHAETIKRISKLDVAIAQTWERCSGRKIPSSIRLSEVPELISNATLGSDLKKLDKSSPKDSVACKEETTDFEHCLFANEVSVVALKEFNKFDVTQYLMKVEGKTAKEAKDIREYFILLEKRVTSHDH